MPKGIRSNGTNIEFWSIRQGQVRVQLQDVVNTVMNLQIP
jgi:hypothetical protein